MRRKHGRSTIAKSELLLQDSSQKAQAGHKKAKSSALRSISNTRFMQQKPRDKKRNKQRHTSTKKAPFEANIRTTGKNRGRHNLKQTESCQYYSERRANGATYRSFPPAPLSCDPESIGLSRTHRTVFLYPVCTAGPWDGAAANPSVVYFSHLTIGHPYPYNDHRRMCSTCPPKGENK